MRRGREGAFATNFDEQTFALQHFGGQAHGLAADTELFGQLDFGGQATACPAFLGDRLPQYLFHLCRQAGRPWRSRVKSGTGWAGTPSRFRLARRHNEIPG